MSTLRLLCRGGAKEGENARGGAAGGESKLRGMTKGGMIRLDLHRGMF